MKILAEASPNIALIKYWGKKSQQTDLDRNIPLNPSISFTLSQAKTQVLLEKSPLDLLMIQSLAADPQDEKKVWEHANRIYAELLQKKLVHESTRPALKLDSKNNFPAGTGMASSASAFAALTTGFLGIFLGASRAEKLLKEEGAWVSSLARRGSGSASRSIFGPWAHWEGAHAQPLKSNWKLHDTVVILSRETKKYSSSFGHQASLTSPLLPERLNLLPKRIQSVLQAIEEKSLKKLGPLIEEEALEMHRVIEAASPSIVYLSENSRAFIEALQSLTERDFYFTADAGPNIHVISVRPIETELKAILARLNLQATVWSDLSGPGPQLREWHER